MDDFFRYWKDIALPIVLKRSIGDSGMKLAFWVFILSALGTIVSVILFLINIASTDLVDFTIEQFVNYGVFFGISVIIAFVSFCILVFTVPPEINKQKENEINKLDNELNSFTPNIQVSGRVFINNVNIGHHENGKYVLSHITNVASVPFSNNPTLSNRNNYARNVRAEIDYLSQDKTTVLTSVQGRWQGLQPNEVTNSDWTILESTNFPNNGAKRALDLIMKYPEDEYCYAYTNESYGLPYFLNPNQIIESKKFFIQVKLKGEYLPDKVHEFEVETEGIGDSFKIRKDGEEWQKIPHSLATKTPKKAEEPAKKKSSRKRTS